MERSTGGAKQIIAIETADRSNKQPQQPGGNEAMQGRPDSAIYPSRPPRTSDFPDTLARLLVSETSAAQSRLAAALSHDLNSPIGALNSALDTMSLILRRHQEQPQKDGNLSQQLLLMKQVAQQSCRRLIEIVSRMRRFTNLERAQVQQADVNDLLRDAIALLRSELERPKVEVKVNFDDLRPLNCKPQQLCSVFLELLRNATAHLQGEGEIQISSTEANNQITIQISDNGRGIDSERLPNLFEPSFTVKDGRVVTSNWALFVSRCVILDHGGQIEIHSTEGKGTCVTIKLPHTTKTQTKENNPMNPSISSQQSTKPSESETANYFGLTVQIIVRMPSYSLICYGNREFVVDTADLQMSLALRQAA